MTEASPADSVNGPEAGAPTRAGISRQLWQDAQQDVQNCLHHPFVRALGAGTLPKCDLQPLMAVQRRHMTHTLWRRLAKLRATAYWPSQRRRSLAHVSWQKQYRIRQPCKRCCPSQQLSHVCRKSFQAYIAQDSHFLTAFAKAYTAALPKAATASPVRHSACQPSYEPDVPVVCS